MKRGFCVLSTSLVLAVACGPDTGGEGEDEGSEVGTGDSTGGDSADGGDAEGDGTSASTSASDGTSADTGAEDTGDTGDTGSGFDPVPALGINITEVEANQGTSVIIGQGGNWVDGPQRNARMVSERDTLIRVHFTIDPGWVPRDIMGVLEVLDPGGNEINTYTQTFNVTQNSDIRFIDTTFFWGLVAEEGETAGGTQYRVTLWEVAPGGEALAPGINANPATGPGFVGFEAADMAINIMYVPITYGPNGKTPDVATDQGTLDQWMLQQNPVRRIVSQVHAPVAYNQTLNNLGSLLGVMQQVQAQDGAASNIYYTALVDTGQQSGVVGIANLGGTVNANLWRNSLSSTAGTVVHEIGHNQGLSHVACPGGQSAGNDPSYPYADGQIGKRGFGIRDFTLYPETNVDYMTYCGPTWVSDWTWEKVWSRIQSFTAQGDVEKVPVLRNAIYPDGTEDWWTVPDLPVNADLISGSYEIEFMAGDEVVARDYAQFETLSDDETIWLTVELPEGVAFEEVTAVRRRADGEQVAEVPRAGISIAHVNEIGPPAPGE